MNTPRQNTHPRIQAALDGLERGQDVARSYDRADLAERLGKSQRVLADPSRTS